MCPSIGSFSHLQHQLFTMLRSKDAESSGGASTLRFSSSRLQYNACLQERTCHISGFDNEAHSSGNRQHTISSKFAHSRRKSVEFLVLLRAEVAKCSGDDNVGNLLCHSQVVLLLLVQGQVRPCHFATLLCQFL